TGAVMDGVHLPVQQARPVRFERTGDHAAGLGAGQHRDVGRFTLGGRGDAHGEQFTMSAHVMALDTAFRPPGAPARSAAAVLAHCWRCATWTPCRRLTSTCISPD